jgi:hypothetical protein
MDSRVKRNTLCEAIEYFLWRPEVEAFARSAVVAVSELIEVPLSDGGEIGFSRQGAAEAADGVFDAALLPRPVWVTEESLEAQMGGELVMQSKFRAVSASCYAEARG